MDSVELDIQIKVKELEIELLKKQRPALIESRDASEAALVYNQKEQVRLSREIVTLLKGEK